MAPVGITGRSTVADSRRLRLSHLRRSPLARLAIVLVLLFVAAVYAGVAHAEDSVVVGDNTTTTTTNDTSTTTDPVTDPPATDPSTDPSSSPSDPNATPTDPIPTEPPADNTGTDPTSPPAGETPPPEPVGSGDPIGGSDGGTPVVPEQPAPVETPPVTDPATPVVDPPASPPVGGGPKQTPALPSFPGTQDAGLPPVAPVATSVSLNLLKIGGSVSTKGRDPHVSDNGTRSTKEQSARRSFPSEGSPASSPSSAASGASGGSGGGGGVALAVEFLLAALLVLRYTRKASFILPDSLAFALREERPG